MNVHAIHKERRRLSRRMIDPYFRFVAVSYLRELAIMGLLFVAVLVVGWYFGI